jgi:spore maturation protein CgeB
MKLVFIGLSITSSWGNGHATTYRALIRGLAERGHEILFLERDAEWYAGNRDLPSPAFCRTALYETTAELKQLHEADIQSSDVVIVGSYVPDGIAVGDLVLRMARGVTAFYDIDTPVTIACLENGRAEYLAARQIPRYHLYLSFTGGPMLERLEARHGAQRARALYCSVDTDLYSPAGQHANPVADTDLGYLGTYSEDRQPVLDRLLLSAARQWTDGRFIVAGPQYPKAIQWPSNVRRVMHLEPALHRQFYTTQRFTLNVTRRDMVAAGFSPSVRLFEAAACGTPIISDVWPGIETLFRPGAEILLAQDASDTLRFLREMPEHERVEIGAAARTRVLNAHTAAHRAAELEAAVAEVRRAGASEQRTGLAAGALSREGGS